MKMNPHQQRVNDDIAAAVSLETPADSASSCMQEALRKMSLMPAQTLEGFVPQMRKNGRLQEGTDADIVVFEP